MGGNGVGQTSGFINIGDRPQDFRRDLFVELDVLVKLGNDGTAQRFDLVLDALPRQHGLHEGNEHVIPR